MHKEYYASNYLTFHKKKKIILLVYVQGVVVFLAIDDCAILYNPYTGNSISLIG